MKDNWSFALLTALFGGCSPYPRYRDRSTVTPPPRDPKWDKINKEAAIAKRARRAQKKAS